MSPVTQEEERATVTNGLTKPLPRRDRAVTAPIRIVGKVLAGLATHLRVRQELLRLQDLPGKLVYRYNVLRNQWRLFMSRHAPALGVQPTFATPGQELTLEEAQRLEEYLKQPEGVTVTVSTWQRDELAKPVSSSAWMNRPVVE